MDTNHSPIISPLTMRESARGITLTSIYDEMLARRELSVMGNIETPMAHDLCQQIRLLDATDPSRPITIFVASAGGSVRSGLAIYDAMRLASCPIRTVCLEFAASMGAVIFMGGDDRRMAPHAELMIHDPLIPQGAGGSALALQETSRRLMQTRKTLTQILSDRSGLTPKRIQSLTAKDTYLSAERAVELGFAHENPLDHQGGRPCLTSPAASPHLSPHRPPSSPRIERFPATPAKRDSTTMHL